MDRKCFPNITIKPGIKPKIKTVNEWLIENIYRLSERLFSGLHYDPQCYNYQFEFLNQLTERNFKSIYGMGNKMYKEFRSLTGTFIPQVREIHFIACDQAEMPNVLTDQQIKDRDNEIKSLLHRSRVRKDILYFSTIQIVSIRNFEYYVNHTKQAVVESSINS